MKFKAFIYCILAITCPMLLTTTAFAQATSFKPQETYERIIQIAQDAIRSPEIDRDDFTRKISQVIKGEDDDQKAAFAGAMVMFDTIESVHKINKLESKVDYPSLWLGSRYKSAKEINKQSEILEEINQITAKTIKNSESTLTRLEKELQKAKVSEARIAAEISAAKSREIETKAQSEKGLKKLQSKISLNNARIKLLEFLSENFGDWTYQDSFRFENKSKYDQFQILLAKVQKQEAEFNKLA